MTHTRTWYLYRDLAAARRLVGRLQDEIENLTGLYVNLCDYDSKDSEENDPDVKSAIAALNTADDFNKRLISMYPKIEGVQL